MRRIASAFLLGLLLAGPRLSAESAPDSGPLLYPRSPAAGAPAKTVSAPSGAATLALVLIAGASGGWLLWKRLRGAPGLDGRRAARDLTIAETRSLGNRQYLVVAAYGRRKFLLGVCPGRIDLLSSLEEGAPPPAP